MSWKNIFKYELLLELLCYGYKNVIYFVKKGLLRDDVSSLQADIMDWI